MEVYGFVTNATNAQTQQALIYSAVAGNVIDAGGVTPPRVLGLGLRYTTSTSKRHWQKQPRAMLAAAMVNLTVDP